MFKESNYDKISINPPSGGMNRNISPEILPATLSYYLENLLPYPLGELNLRNGTSQVFNLNQGFNKIIEAFPYRLANGNKQIILYMSKYTVLPSFTNAVVLSSNSIQLTSPNYALFQADTFLSLTYMSSNGTSQVILQINRVTFLGANTINIEFSYNSLPHNLQNFYVVGGTNIPTVGGITWIANNKITVNVPVGYNSALYYYELQNTKLVINGGDPVPHIISMAGIDPSIPGQITFTFTDTTIPVFGINDAVSFSYQSSVPQIISISSSSGFIQIYDFASNQVLTGGNQTLTGLSLACLPRGEFQAQFGQNIYWIYNGVDPNMTWDGTTLKVYTEFVKEFANSFNRINNTNFSFISNVNFDITKYGVGNLISLNINGVSSQLTVSNIVKVNQLITITTVQNLPAFAGGNIIDLFYTDKPPPFSFMKSINQRMFCLGPGAVGINYRASSEALKFYYSFKTNTETTGFKFFDASIKEVRSVNIAANHNGADNLEAIVGFSGKVAFMGRNETQIWNGNNPIDLDSPNVFKWERTMPIGIAHGNLFIEMDNDVSFINSNGGSSFSTLNIGNQVMVNPVEALDPLTLKYIHSLSISNLAYRACRSFKYKNGPFAGFKIGFNNIIVSLYKTSLYSWTTFSGDFVNSTTFLTGLDEALYLFIDDLIYQYSDGTYSPRNYADQNGTASIKFLWTAPYIQNRWANKFVQVHADYTSSFIINDQNAISVLIRGDLRKNFTLENPYEFEDKGDPLGSIPLALGNSQYTGGPGLRLNIPYSFPVQRLKFQGLNFWVSIAGKSVNGPFSFKNINLYGIKQR